MKNKFSQRHFPKDGKTDIFCNNFNMHLFKNEFCYNQGEAMKRFSVVMLSILLLTFGVTMNVGESFADAPMQEKENIIQDLKDIKNR